MWRVAQESVCFRTETASLWLGTTCSDNLVIKCANAPVCTESVLSLPTRAISITKPHVYKPGQYAPVTGSYLVHHAIGHRADHEATIIRTEEFPGCRVCRGDVQYTVLREVSHITHDPDFAGPTELVIARTARGAKSARQAPRGSLAQACFTLSLVQKRQP